MKKEGWRVFKLSMTRAGSHCPPWARTSRYRRAFLKIYTRAAYKNRFRMAYGNDGERYHVDHIIPLHGKNVYGLHVPWNLKVIAAAINQSKGTMIVEEWGLTANS